VQRALASEADCEQMRRKLGYRPAVVISALPLSYEVREAGMDERVLRRILQPIRLIAGSIDERWLED